jgi:hypothetical protein
MTVAIAITTLLELAIFLCQATPLPDDCAVVSTNLPAKSIGRDGPFPATGSGLIRFSLVLDLFTEAKVFVVQRCNPCRDTNGQQLIENG